ITDNDELQQLFLDACRANNYVTTVKTKLNDIIDAYPSILKPALECMNFEITGDAGTAFSLGDLFENQVLTFPGAVNSTPVSNYSQYLYDYIRDVADCYNDLYSLVADLISECGGNEYCYPFHVMLGIPQTNDTLSCYKEGKFSESNYKYRSYFVPSPLVDSQFNLAEKIEQSLKRLVRVVAFFKIDADLTAIKIIPGKDYDTDISIRAIPYYYEADRFEDFFRIWNYDCTRHNKLTNPRGYHATNDENIFLRNDTRKINFYRIEGHIGNPVSSALTDIQAIQNQYNLPFNVISVPLNNNSDDETNASCSFEDLEAEYNYYRDRALGYLREITRWIQEAMLLINDLIKENNKTNTEILQRLQKYLSSIYGYIAKGMLDILYNARCIERFDYAIYKTFYTKIWEVVFDMYYANYTDYNYYNQNVLKSPNQALNSIINILSVPFLQPIYRIWYMYQYRLSITEQIQAIDLQTLASKNTGFEHLAGVRRGETFVLVSDPAQTAEDGKGIVVADFNIPSYNNCSCDCKSCNEDTPAEVKVSPFQKPIIMVIDPYQKESAITNDENDILKLKAHLDPKDNYVLELDSMGFYKADSAIDPSIIITSTEDADFGNVFEPMKESVWINGGEKGDNMNLVYNSQYLKGALYKRLNYVLTGNFETVTGNLYLIILGGYDYAGGTYPVYTNDEHTYMYYPYKSEAVKDINPQMMFNGATETKVIGNETKQVYTAASGNQYTIGKDKDELPYIDALSIKNPGVDNIPFILKTDDSSTAASVTMNVIDKTDKLPDNTVSGIIKNSDGIPIANAKLTTTSGKEVITNDKGEYSLADIKSGDMITVEKQGFETANIQVHSQMATDIQMQKTPLIDVAAVNKLDPTGKLANIASNINTAVFKNFMQ
ncbi:MAG: carboxypeptidase regulatory-like domain-containing protein, partial [Parafilimonas sp.]|nr:carboxypeptidase regulatory-like domain-containing protein [Parafilimonas sp.]